MPRRTQIVVVGYGEDVCTREAYISAYDVGREVARAGAVVLTGGLGGVMAAACRGAKDAGGIAVGIVPGEDLAQANNYCDVVVATGMGYARNFLTAYSGDAVIVVGGGAGTLIEAAAAYMKGKPVVALRGAGGVADEIAGRYLDERNTVRVVAADYPREAVAKAMELATKMVKA